MCYCIDYSCLLPPAACLLRPASCLGSDLLSVLDFLPDHAQPIVTF
jgi:hypothetical protein